MVGVCTAPVSAQEITVFGVIRTDIPSRQAFDAAAAGRVTGGAGGGSLT
jgi:hypothetical protein